MRCKSSDNRAGWLFAIPPDLFSDSLCRDNKYYFLLLNNFLLDHPLQKS